MISLSYVEFEDFLRVILISHENWKAVTDHSKKFVCFNNAVIVKVLETSISVQYQFELSNLKAFYCLSFCAGMPKMELLGADSM